MKKELIANLSFEKKLVPSDAFMYGTTWANRDQVDNEDVVHPLLLREKTVRGTKDHGKSKEKDIMKLNMEATQPNLHRVDHCSLKRNDDTLVVDFTMKVLPKVWEPVTCSSKKHFEAITSSVKKSKDSVMELAKRYAINLANGRFLWRNRVGASEIEVIVSVLANDQSIKQSFVFDAYDYSLAHFNAGGDKKISGLAMEIFSALMSEDDFVLLRVTASVLMGRGQDVYPSQELILDKEKSASKKGEKSKVLYHEDGVAGMHSQKIGNAIRTVDTWYDGSHDSKPLAISPYGADTHNAAAYRTPKTKRDYYSILDKVVAGRDLDPSELIFFTAMHLRGGVFGRSDK
jgi:CRISPR-associated protein Csy3